MSTLSSNPSTQDFLPIEEVRDGLIILKNGGMRMVLMASSLNFSLKSQEEQMAILFQFQNFLNSLDFDTQLYVQSRGLDIRPYLATLEDRLKDQMNDLLKIQIKEYIEFIRSFVQNTNIMSKSFYVAIPYNPPIIGGSEGFFSVFKKNKKKMSVTSFEENRAQIEQRADVIDQGLSRIGVRTVRLGTEELIELFFKIFNPEEIVTPSIFETTK